MTISKRGDTGNRPPTGHETLRGTNPPPEPRRAAQDQDRGKTNNWTLRGTNPPKRQARKTSR